jgi:hypothetical protein
MHHRPHDHHKWPPRPICSQQTIAWTSGLYWALLTTGTHKWWWMPWQYCKGVDSTWNAASLRLGTTCYSSLTCSLSYEWNWGPKRSNCIEWWCMLVITILCCAACVNCMDFVVILHTLFNTLLFLNPKAIFKFQPLMSWAWTLSWYALRDLFCTVPACTT